MTSVEGVSNFRDVGATVKKLSGADGVCAIASGRLFRGVDLSAITDSGLEKMRELGITDVIDLRTDVEVNRSAADILPEGARYHFIPINAMLEEEAHVDIILATEDNDLEQVVLDGFPEHLQTSVIEFNGHQLSINKFFAYSFRSMRQLYARFVTSTTIRELFGRALKVIATSPRSYIHCHAGKDRTGWLTALCNLIAGISEQLVIKEYMLSANAAPNEAKLLAKRFSIEDWRIFIPFATVYEQYLGEAIAKCKELTVEAGASADNWLNNYLHLCGLKTVDIENIKNSLLSKDAV
ncbi:MAG: tyrosine-protein phosphatase [Candidatus Ancillula trichonymphae]|jgi:protein-tyrosine phosphatase|nr:tyrosine-protein phosphatase [Candidatus Ancillula trichonymphae]